MVARVRVHRGVDCAEANAMFRAFRSRIERRRIERHRAAVDSRRRLSRVLILRAVMVAVLQPRGEVLAELVARSQLDLVFRAERARSREGYGVVGELIARRSNRDEHVVGHRLFVARHERPEEVPADGNVRRRPCDERAGAIARADGEGISGIDRNACAEQRSARERAPNMHARARRESVLLSGLAEPDDLSERLYVSPTVVTRLEQRVEHHPLRMLRRHEGERLRRNPGRGNADRESVQHA